MLFHYNRLWLYHAITCIEDFAIIYHCFQSLLLILVIEVYLISIS